MSKARDFSMNWNMPILANPATYAIQATAV
jgi:hypothetical protein